MSGSPAMLKPSWGRRVVLGYDGAPQWPDSILPASLPRGGGRGLIRAPVTGDSNFPEKVLYMKRATSSGLGAMLPPIHEFRQEWLLMSTNGARSPKDEYCRAIRGSTRHVPRLPKQSNKQTNKRRNEQTNFTKAKEAST